MKRDKGFPSEATLDLIADLFTVKEKPRERATLCDRKFLLGLNGSHLDIS